MGKNYFKKSQKLLVKINFFTKIYYHTNLFKLNKTQDLLRNKRLAIQVNGPRIYYVHCIQRHTTNNVRALKVIYNNIQ